MNFEEFFLRVTHELLLSNNCFTSNIYTCSKNSCFSSLSCLLVCLLATPIACLNNYVFWGQNNDSTFILKTFVGVNWITFRKIPKYYSRFLIVNLRLFYAMLRMPFVFIQHNWNVCPTVTLFLCYRCHSCLSHRMQSFSKILKYY